MGAATGQDNGLIGLIPNQQPIWFDMAFPETLHAALKKVGAVPWSKLGSSCEGVDNGLYLAEVLAAFASEFLIPQKLISD